MAWIKSDTKTILAIHTRMVTLNPRLSVTHNGHNTWKLYISNVEPKDSGTYMCQINTDPMKSQVSEISSISTSNIPTICSWRSKKSKIYAISPYAINVLVCRNKSLADFFLCRNIRYFVELMYILSSVVYLYVYYLNKLFYYYDPSLWNRNKIVRTKIRFQINTLVNVRQFPLV